MRRNNYSNISNFGPSGAYSPSNNPLNYCVNGDTVDSGFMHGGIGLTIGSAHGKHCQAFMSDYCSENWDGICEYESENQSRIYPNNLQNCHSCSEVSVGNLDAGQVLIRNTAQKKYLKNMGGNCGVEFQPFDPSVANSPLVGFFTGGGERCCHNQQGNNQCIPVYAVDPKTIDNDPVMNKILVNPGIAWGILVNIYNTAVNDGTLNGLKGTKINNLFESVQFQNYIKQSQIMSEQAFGPHFQQYSINY